MTFTDDDLKRLKEIMQPIQSSSEGDCCFVPIWMVEALFARLEAAEVAMGTIAEVHQEHCDNGDCAEVLEAWRKAAGK